MALRPPTDDQIRAAAWIARTVGRAESVPLTEADIGALGSYLSERRLSAGQVAFRAGEPPSGVFVLRAGAIELSVDAGRRRVVVFVLKPGDIEGDIALLLDQPPPYTARALDDSTCLFLSEGSFERLLSEHPRVARRWLSSCAVRLQKGQARILELLARSLREQIARLLLDEAVEGVVRLPQRTVAAMLGVQRPSVNRALKDLEREGVVRLRYAEIQITDPATLERSSRRLPGGP